MSLQIQRPRWVTVASHRAPELEPSGIPVRACFLHQYHPCPCKTAVSPLEAAVIAASVWGMVLLSISFPCRYGNFLTEEECDHLIKLSKPHMEDAAVVNKTTGVETPNR